MSDSVDEQLSALLDSEVTAEELDLLLARLDRDDASRQRIARYALIGAALRSEPSSVQLAFADRFRTGVGEVDSLDARTGHSRGSVRARSAWLSLAAAAMVAALAVGVAPLWAPGEGP